MTSRPTQSSCVTKYFADLTECDRRYEEDKQNCLGVPECIQAARARRTNCENEAYVRYLSCLTGGTFKNLAANQLQALNKISESQGPTGSATKALAQTLNRPR